MRSDHFKFLKIEFNEIQLMKFKTGTIKTNTSIFKKS